MTDAYPAHRAVRIGLLRHLCGRLPGRRRLTGGWLTPALALAPLPLWNYICGVELASSGLKIPGLYRLVRHPMMLGLLIAFWATPTMTTDRLLFALGMSAYILIGVSYEERDLLRAFGASYTAYRRRAPMLVPWPQRRVSAPVERRQPGDPTSVS